jgi:DDE family transposase
MACIPICREIVIVSAYDHRHPVFLIAFALPIFVEPKLPVISLCFINSTHRRQATRALAGTPAYEHSQRARYRIEALFAELKQRIRLGRVRLRRLWNVGEQFLLAATAQNLKRLVRFLVQRPPMQIARGFLAN